MTNKKMELVFKWTTSRAKLTFGYNVVSLFVDGVKVAACNGGGYDMKGAALGDWVAKRFKDELLTIPEPVIGTGLDGLSFIDPTYDPGKENKSLGLERLQAFHRQTSKIPTKSHTIPMIDGAHGYNAVENILKAIGYEIERERSKNNVYFVDVVAAIPT